MLSNKLIYIILIVAFYCHSNCLAQINVNKSSLDSIYKMSSSLEMDNYYRLEMKRKNNTFNNKSVIDAQAYIAMQAVWGKNEVLAERYIMYIKEPILKSNKYFGLARVFYQNKIYDKAEQYTQLAIDSILPYINIDDASYEDALKPKSILAYSTLLYVSVQKQMDKLPKAIAMIEKVKPLVDVKNAKGLEQLEGDLYMDMKHYERSLDRYNSLFLGGNESIELKNKMRMSFNAIHGVDSVRFKQFVDSLSTLKFEYFSKDVKEANGRILAANFNLKDLKGEFVNLKDLKGKVVVLDFWAMWCAPCKASFPAMRQVLDRYKNNKDVVFLFIDTWENNTSNKEISKYMEGNQYNFRVLKDEIDPCSGKYRTVTGYEVKGLPEKVVIDPEGHIYYRMTGYNGNTESTVRELSYLIDKIINK